MDQAQPSLIRVLLVDDHQLLTDALAGLLGRETDIEVMGIASSVSEAKHAARRPVDVVLMDYALPDGTGADATRAIKARWPDTKVVMLSAITEDETVLDAIRAGVDGYLTKDRASEEVVSAVRSAHAGDILLPRELVFEIAQRVAGGGGAGGGPRPPRPAAPPRPGGGGG
jgi:two-component system, NarL family, nitrate/nitrite response regulator NarL